MKKVVYIAHPVTGGRYLENIGSIKEIGRKLARTYPEIIPFCPYLFTLEILDNYNKREREIGKQHNRAIFERRAFDELWLFGSHISEGMAEEIKWAEEFGIPVVDKTAGVDSYSP